MGDNGQRETWRVRGRTLDGASDAYLSIAITTQGDVCVNSPGGAPVVLDMRRTQRLRHKLGWALGAILCGLRW